VYTAPAEHPAQRDRRVDVEAVAVRPGRELGCERVAGRRGRWVSEFAEDLEQQVHHGLRRGHQSLRVRFVGGLA
jgi:hypothetical protein